MDPYACIESIRIAYGENDYDGIVQGCTYLLEWLHKGGVVPSLLEPELSALLIMSLAYGERQQVRHAPEYLT